MTELSRVLDLPVVGAPMAGVSTPALVAAVSEAGGLGSWPAAYQSARAMAEAVRDIRELTERPFAVNVFCPTAVHREDQQAAVTAYADRLRPRAARLGVELPDPDWADDHDWAAKIELLCAIGPAVVSFTFGCPPAATVERLRRAGSLVAVTVTRPQDAAIAAEAGADLLCVQGAEAGGHRSTFTGAETPEPASHRDLLVSCADVGLPMVAAGGVMDAADTGAALAAGAVAVQCGTALLLADEAATSEPYRAALREPGRRTTVTRTFSGRPARGLANAWSEELEAYAPPAFPVVDQLTKPLRAAATRAGDREAVSLWAGTGWQRARTGPAAELVRDLAG